MATIKAVLWKQKSRDGTHPVYMRIEAANQRCYISTGEWVKPADWNPGQECDDYERPVLGEDIDHGWIKAPAR